MNRTLLKLESIALLLCGLTFVSCSDDDEEKESGNGVENGFEYVDMGLSVKWATCNVGATKPEEAGDYFAWGEIEPKEYYGLSNYKYYDESMSAYTKYTTSTQSTLDVEEDDAARANMGGRWRMPSDDEWSELMQNCVWEWENLNGVEGYRVTSQVTKNSIFLPALGWKNFSDYVYDESNKFGVYWSSSLYVNDCLMAWHLYFCCGAHYHQDKERYGGKCVRAVLPPSYE